ncbi:siroheme synthase [Ceraceosorus bombacis]|uniref:precorrin-2 dehydrogenase n=1 Tax=Ceraceosorus bombacis TaxID=401625 RepID=A0A0P1BBI5_9BASI|nr:siroheme synthase [Ceraceosorus bombacis]
MGQADYPQICPGGGLIISWQLKRKRVLLVGGGPVAAGRLVNVKDADAIVTVICPSSGLCGEMKHRIYVEKCVDEYEDRVFGGKEDVMGYDMVLTAIDDAALSREICQMARALRIPVNVADVPPECDFYFGSLIRRGPLQVMVSTGGKGPRIAAQTRRIIQRAIPKNLGQAIENVGRLRAMLRSEAPQAAAGPKRMSWMIDVCEKWSFDELATLEEDEMRIILRGWKDGSVPSARQVRGISRTLPDSKRIRKAIVGRCPVAGYISPWLAGFAGILLGSAITSTLFIARSSKRA